MTEKPSRERIQLRGSGVPYHLVCISVWGATALSYFPRWFSDAAYDFMEYILDVVREFES